MNCREFENLVDAFIEGTLDSKRQSVMDEHARECPSCRALREVMTTLDTTGEMTAPAGFADRLRARIEMEESGRIIPFPANTANETFLPITCGTFNEQVAAFVDGSIDSVLGKQMAEHRHNCAVCDRLARTHETVLATLVTAEPIIAPDGFAARVREAVLEEQSEVSVQVTSLFWKLDYLVAACVSVMVLTGLYLLFPKYATSAGENSIFASFLESVVTRLTVTPLIFKAWIAAMIPAEQWIFINRLTEPVVIPFLPVEFSLIFYLSAAFMLLTAYVVVQKFSTPKITFSSYPR